MHIETISVNRPDRPADQLPPLEAEEASATTYLKDGRPFASLLRLLAISLANPLVVLRGLLAVIGIHGLTLRQRAFWLFYLAEALLVGRWMKHRNLRHLHVHFGGPVASVGMLVAAAWGFPYSLTIHGPEELLDVSAYHLREKLDAASFIFCISDFCRSQLYALTPPAQWHKFKVIRLGVDPVMLTPHSRMTTSGVTFRGVRVPELVCVGRLVPAKGHRILLEALYQLRQRDIPLRLTLIGGGPERSALEALVARYSLTDAVTFTSALSHPETLSQLRRADIFALASFAEGIPVALMEAMALGLPCIATTVAGIPELITSGIEGILVPPANAQALADALETLATDAALRKHLGYAGRQRVIAEYNLPLNQELLAHTFENRLRGKANAKSERSAR